MTDEQKAFQEWSFEEERQLRGKVIQVSVDIEFVLLKIILACLMDKPDEAVRKYAKLPIEQKITMFRHDLKNSYPELYEKSKVVLTKLDKAKDFRNKFAHSQIGWDLKKKDRSYFNILVISEVAGQEKVSMAKMTFEDFNERLSKMKLCLFMVTRILEAVQDEWNKKYPDYFMSL